MGRARGPGLAALALALAAGCGRLGFDELSDGAPVDACAFGAWSAPVQLALSSTTQDDFGAELSPDGLTLVFHLGEPSDLLMATRATQADAWGVPTPIAALEDPANDQSPTFGADGLTLFYGSARSGQMRLYRSMRASSIGAFGVPSIVGELGAVEVWGSELSADGRELFFNSYDGAFGAALQYATADASGVFTVRGPITELAISAYNGWASMSADRRTLYWEGRATQPQLWVYTANRDGFGTDFHSVAPAPFSGGAFQDGDPEISRDGRTLIFSSTRGGSGYDLWQVTRECL